MKEVLYVIPCGETKHNHSDKFLECNTMKEAYKLEKNWVFRVKVNQDKCCSISIC